MSKPEIMAQHGVSRYRIDRVQHAHGLDFRQGHALTGEQREAAHRQRMAPRVPLPANFDALRIGKAGEYLVCSQLLERGYSAFPSDQGLPYDLIVDAPAGVFRVQVKTAVRPGDGNARGRAPNFVYTFNVRSRGRNRKGARLSAETCDAVALVGLVDKQVAYFRVSEVGQTVALFPPGRQFAGRYQRRRHQSIAGYPPERIFDV